jgi:hypothetical protein
LVVPVDLVVEQAGSEGAVQANPNSSPAVEEEAVEDTH